MQIATDEMRFLIHDVFDFASHYAALGIAGAPDRETIDAILEEMARFANDELAPLNRIGDEHGCRLVDGVVVTPPGFREAYAAYAAGGWPGLTGSTVHGGQGLPDTMGLFVEELIGIANVAWAMYPGLSHAAQEALEHHGSAQQRADFLPHLISGRWTGTMCLTEAHAGSDVGLLRTRAEPQADGSYRVTGTKIFISAGDHDLSDNIVHLVLARIAGAPPGTRGISMFVVPKIDLDGTRNAVVCGGLEEKMGIHGNATCVLHFEEARGYLVGEPEAGMSYMFTMMNAARLVVGMQGICLAQAAHARAGRYATERLQMRALKGPARPDLEADPLLVHPDVRRMLLTQKAFIEGGRALVYFAGQLMDTIGHSTDAAVRQRSAEELDFLTPIVKGFLTEVSFEAVNHGVQIFGGHGYIRETGVEQFVRDARITMIYEGTTQIQALDLLGRKVMLTRGKGLTHVVGRMNALAAGIADAMPAIAARLTELGADWAAVSLALGAKAAEDPEEVGAAAVDYLFFSGYLMLAWVWARMAFAARGDDAFAAGKRATCRFYFERILPRAAAHKVALAAGAALLMDVPDAALVPDGARTREPVYVMIDPGL